MRTKKLTINLESVKWHLLLRLFNSDKPISPGQIKSELFGVPVSYDEVYDSLWNLGQVAPVTGGIQLSDEGRLYLEKELKAERQRILHWITEEEFDTAILDFLYHRRHLVHIQDFPDILVKTAPQYNNMVGQGNLTHRLHKMSAHVDHPELKWYGISEIGSDIYEVKEAKEGRPTTATISSVSNVDNGFNEQEKKEMNAKLDQVRKMISTEFEKVKMGQELSYNDIMEEINELRQYYNLPKKTWRQLATGKLAEMVVSGIVSATISQRIADHINPTIERLLQG